MVEQITLALEMAAKHMSKERGSAVANIMDFGPAKRRFLKQRRQDVAQELGVSVKHLEETLEKELLEKFASHLVRLAAERPPSADGQTTQQPQPPVMAKSQRPTVPVHKNKPVDGAVPKAIVSVMAEEVREVCSEGLTRAITKKRLPLLTRLAETVIPGNGTIPQKTDELLTRVIREVEQSTVVQMGIMELLELGGLRNMSLSERRQRSRSNLVFAENPRHDSRFKPHRQKEKEERIFKALAKPLAALAIQHGTIK